MAWIAPPCRPRGKHERMHHNPLRLLTSRFVAMNLSARCAGGKEFTIPFLAALDGFRARFEFLLVRWGICFVYRCGVGGEHRVLTPRQLRSATYTIEVELVERQMVCCAFSGFLDATLKEVLSASWGGKAANDDWCATIPNAEILDMRQYACWPSCDVSLRRRRASRPCSCNANRGNEGADSGYRNTTRSQLQ